ncbi:galactocerebrosidase [Plakobranchus ocellatus]|uniref:galactosylceramidase n=1 Tax=Plakobranchus ocellatus TaxID=259542 RepID=A0AAV3YHB6_9GAST|nr:galactocerebrosidase [Plakobranchus ocellatus]
MARILPFLCFLCFIRWICADTITFDSSQGYGRRFDGIGGLSGGGATSKLLISYPEPQRSEILDFLFKPNFGASLQMLKVEIGGDIQSTDGSEASHMRYTWEENYERGYEWWLMEEAKKRNPNIRLYGLPWGFPGWVGEGTGDPYHNGYKTADYIARWINGAKTKHNLTIHFIGIWNENHYDISYIKALRKTLDNYGFNKTKIVAADGKWDNIVNDMKKDKELKKIVHAIGCHYPGTQSTNDAQSLGNPLWSSEDFCQKNTEVGGACWARVLNRNYVHGYMTSTIAWDLIASYYKDLPGWDMGLMTAKEPWNGYYVVSPPIWTSAHTTQFTSVGWDYLKHGSGVGTLPKGGTYVALANPRRDQLTIIMETMTFEHSKCVWDQKTPFKVEPQNVTLVLKDKLANINVMNMWFTELRFDGKNSTYFEQKKPLKFINGAANVFIDLNQIITLTTLNTGNKGSHPPPPQHVAFPLPFSDNYEGYRMHQEPNYLSQQTGSFEVILDGNNGFARQMLTQMPIPWCKDADDMQKAYNIFGDYTWADILVGFDFRIPKVNGSSGVFVGARSTKAGCGSASTSGIFFFALPDRFEIATDVRRNHVVQTGTLSYSSDSWHNISLHVKGTSVTAKFDQKTVYSGTITSGPSAGWAALGTDSYGLADFDNLEINST